MRLSRRSRTSTNRFFLPTFGAHLPGIPTDIGSKLLFYPAPHFSESGFDLDCTPMLVSSGLVIDTFLREYLEAERPPYLMEMKETLEALSDEGLVEFIDFSRCARQFSRDLEAHVDEHLDSPLLWLRLLRAAVRIHRPLIDKQVEQMTGYVDPKPNGCITAC